MSVRQFQPSFCKFIAYKKLKKDRLEAGGNNREKKTEGQLLRMNAGGMSAEVFLGPKQGLNGDRVLGKGHSTASLKGWRKRGADIKCSRV